MECAECVRLRAEHQHRKRIYEMASLKLSAAATSADREQFAILKVMSDQAKDNLNRAEAVLAQHQEGHE